MQARITLFQSTLSWMAGSAVVMVISFDVLRWRFNRLKQL